MSDSIEFSKHALFMLQNMSAYKGTLTQAFIDESMDMLTQEDLAECILTLTLQGNEAQVRALVERRGLVAIELKSLNSMPPTYLFNDRPIKLYTGQFLRTAKRPQAMNSLLAMIAEYGMKGLIEPGESYPVMLRNIQSSPFQDKFNDLPFDGELPALIDGVLSHPELAIALNDRSLLAVAPGAYAPLLCWASEHMVNQFPEQLIPLRVFQDVEGHGTLDEWKAKAGEPGNLEFDKIVIGVEASEKNSAMANCLIGPMAPESAKMGFSDLEGRLLCESTTDFLLNFEVSSCTEENLNAAGDFINNYCPIEIMAKQAAIICVRDYGHDMPYQGIHQIFETTMRSNFEPLFHLLDFENTLCNRATDMMTWQQWECLIQKADHITISPESLLNVWRALGIDNTGKRLMLDPEEVVFLIKNNYRFSDESRVLEDVKSFNQHCTNNGIANPTCIHFKGSLSSHVTNDFEGDDDKCWVTDTVDFFKDILNANLWPSKDARPEDMVAALKVCARLDLDDLENNKAMTLRAYLMNAGVDGCVKAATTPAQWVKLTTVFTTDELKPYLSIMPKEAKGRLLENVMGL